MLVFASCCKIDWTSLLSWRISAWFRWWRRELVSPAFRRSSRRWPDSTCAIIASFFTRIICCSPASLPRISRPSPSTTFKQSVIPICLRITNKVLFTFYLGSNKSRTSQRFMTRKRNCLTSYAKIRKIVFTKMTNLSVEGSTASAASKTHTPMKTSKKTDYVPSV